MSLPGNKENWNLMPVILDLYVEAKRQIEKWMHGETAREEAQQERGWERARVRNTILEEWNGFVLTILKWKYYLIFKRIEISKLSLQKFKSLGNPWRSWSNFKLTSFNFRQYEMIAMKNEPSGALIWHLSHLPSLHPPVFGDYVIFHVFIFWGVNIKSFIFTSIAVISPVVQSRSFRWIFKWFSALHSSYTASPCPSESWFNLPSVW